MMLHAFLTVTAVGASGISGAVDASSVDRDVVYATAAGTPIMMDMHYPAIAPPWPCIVAVHGGGWSEGDKEGFHFGLAKRGFLVATINYRMYPDHRFPAMIEDVKSAVRFLRANAARFRIDAGRIALLGHSAGAHLAVLAAFAGVDAGWDVGDHLDQSSTVCAVVDLSGPTDLTREFPEKWANDLRFTVFGAEQWEAASPVSWAGSDRPPLLIIHGAADPVVPIEHAHALYRAVRSAGGRADLVVVRGAGHGFEPVGRVIWPPVPLLVSKAGRFLSRYMR